MLGLNVRVKMRVRNTLLIPKGELGLFKIAPFSLVLARVPADFSDVIIEKDLLLQKWFSHKVMLTNPNLTTLNPHFFISENETKQYT